MLLCNATSYQDDEKEIEEWFNQMQQQGGKKTARQQQQEKFGALANDDDSDDDSDDEDVNDKETEEFLSEVDDLFTLEPEEFERKMETYDKRQANARRDFDDDEEDDDSLEDTDEADEIEIDRATERISKKKLLKVLDDLQPGGGGKNAESMTPPSTYSLLGDCSLSMQTSSRTTCLRLYRDQELGAAGEEAQEDQCRSHLVPSGARGALGGRLCAEPVAAGLGLERH